MTAAIDPGALAAARDSRPSWRIVLVLAGLGAGGAERVVSLIAGRWVAEGHQVTVVAFDRDDEPVFHAFDPAVRIVRLGIGAASGRTAGMGSSIKRAWALRRTLSRLEPDVTISFLTKINVLALLACLDSRRPLIVSERNNPRLQQSNSLWNTLFAGLNWRADVIVMQTAASMECLARRARRRARVIPNPIQVQRTERIPGTAFSMTAVGRLTHQKGFDMLIRAFALIANDHPQWQLVIWGEGQARGELERQIEEAGLAARVLMPGNCASPEEWVARSDAFVLSSRYEGFGNVLAEAMAGGLPVVSFNCDYGPADIIDDERNGLMVRNGDTAALAQALDRLMSDAPLRARLGNAARATAARFDPVHIASQWGNVIAEAIDGKARPG